MKKLTKESPVPLDSSGRSEEYLVLIQTPSTLFWDIAHYDANYERPWRKRTNVTVDGSVVRYQELPEAKL